jgi:Post-segregation antitoxin CcdA
MYLANRTQRLSCTSLTGITMNDPTLESESERNPIKVSVQIDSELLEQIKHLTNDPSKVIETALRQWLRGERHREDELSRTLLRNPPVPARGEWND